VDPKATREKIDELNRELAPVKEQKNKLKNEAQQWMEKRDQTRQQVKELQSEIANLKQQRDEINQKVKDLKIIRDQLVFERKEKLDKVIEYKQKIASLKQNPSKVIQALQNEIDSLDWKIQTSSLTVTQEKRIGERIADLEKQLVSYKQAQAMWNEIKTLQQQLRTLRTQEKEYHQQVSQHAEQSRQIHQTMNEKGANIPKLKAEADEAHKKYIENRRQEQKLYRQSLPLIAQIRALLTQVKSEEEKKKTKRQIELLQELEKSALEKMKRGKKLTWEEFKILAEKGLTET
jgi:uncharacterized coiled-coil DUF342 family protein